MREKVKKFLNFNVRVCGHNVCITSLVIETLGFLTAPLTYNVAEFPVYFLSNCNHVGLLKSSTTLRAVSNYQMFDIFKIINT